MGLTGYYVSAAGDGVGNNAVGGSRFVPISPVKWEDTDQFLSELFFFWGGGSHCIHSIFF